MLIDVVEAGAKTKEVYFGKLEHHEKKLANLNKTAKQVSRVILNRAAKYNKIEEIKACPICKKPIQYFCSSCNKNTEEQIHLDCKPDKLFKKIIK